MPPKKKKRVFTGSFQVTTTTRKPEPEPDEESESRPAEGLTTNAPESGRTEDPSQETLKDEDPLDATIKKFTPNSGLLTSLHYLPPNLIEVGDIHLPDSTIEEIYSELVAAGPYIFGSVSTKKTSLPILVHIYDALRDSLNFEKEEVERGLCQTGGRNLAQIVEYLLATTPLSRLPTSMGQEEEPQELPTETKETGPTLHPDVLNLLNEPVEDEISREERLELERQVPEDRYLNALEEVDQIRKEASFLQKLSKSHPSLQQLVSKMRAVRRLQNSLETELVALEKGKYGRFDVAQVTQVYQDRKLARVQQEGRQKKEHQKVANPQKEVAPSAAPPQEAAKSSESSDEVAPMDLFEIDDATTQMSVELKKAGELLQACPKAPKKPRYQSLRNWETLRKYVNAYLMQKIPGFKEYQARGQVLDRQIVSQVPCRHALMIRVCESWYFYPKCWSSQEEALDFQAAYLLYALNFWFDPRKSRTLTRYQSIFEPYLDLFSLHFRDSEEEQKLLKYRERFAFCSSILPKEQVSEEGLTHQVEARKFRQPKFDQIAAFVNAHQLNPSNPDIQAQRQALPANRYREAILEMVAAEALTIISGATGSGKTTQVAQYLLEDACQQGTPINVFIAEPRRLAAVSVAARVGVELGHKGLSSHHIRLDNTVNPMTALTFGTNGVLLGKQQSDLVLNEYTHIILDEVHERTMETDVLLLFLREILKTRKDLKVILMSATLDVEKYMGFYEVYEYIEMEGRAFPVEAFYLENLPVAEPDRDMDEWNGDKIQYDLVKKLVFHIHDTTDYAESILIFLPGISEIHKCASYISGGVGIQLFYLHSQVQNFDVFQNTAPHRRKVVLSTNIAETGVTIPDIVHVIDSGRAKVMKYSDSTHTQRLDNEQISQAEVLQRRGRAGRVKPGKAYHLFSASKQLKEFPMPEILRASLLDIILQLCCQNRSPDLLESLIDPPPSGRIQQSIQLINKLGILDGKHQPTRLGLTLYQLKIPDVRMAKLLFHADKLGVLGPCARIAACLSSRSPFNLEVNTVHPMVHKLKGLRSDHLMLLAAINQFSEWKKQGKKTALKNCASNKMSYSACDLILQTAQSMANNDEAINGDESLIQAIILSGLYPNVGMRKDGEVLLPNREVARIPSSSIISPRNGLVTFHEKTKVSAKLCLRDLSCVSHLALILLTPAELKISFTQHKLCCGPFVFNCQPRTAALLSQLRYRFNETVLEAHPNQAIVHRVKELLSASANIT